MRISIIVRFTFETVHSWLGATAEYGESYLQYPHRHMMHVEAAKDVGHADRDIEFIALRRDLMRFCKTRWPSSHTDSCEMIAMELVQQYGLRSCRVFEDGENGAEVEA